MFVLALCTITDVVTFALGLVKDGDLAVIHTRAVLLPGRSTFPWFELREVATRATFGLPDVATLLLSQGPSLREDGPEWDVELRAFAKESGKTVAEVSPVEAMAAEALQGQAPGSELYPILGVAEPYLFSGYRLSASDHVQCAQEPLWGTAEELRTRVAQMAPPRSVGSDVWGLGGGVARRFGCGLGFKLQADLFAPHLRPLPGAAGMMFGMPTAEQMLHRYAFRSEQPLPVSATPGFSELTSRTQS